jgi:hypothetical protein
VKTPRGCVVFLFGVGILRKFLPVTTMEDP